MRLVFPFAIWQAEYLLLLFGAQHASGVGSPGGKIFGERLLGTCLHAVHFHHMGDELGNIVCLRKHQHNLQRPFLGYGGEQFLQLVAGLGI